MLVVGPSGSGKSSLLRAGVIPALEARTPAWHVLLFPPGGDPLRELAGQIAARTGTNLDDVQAGLLDDPAVVMAAAAAGGRLLIVVDQFEEVFTTCSVASVRTAFVAALAAAASTGHPHEPRPAVVLGLRADFYGDVLRDPLLARVAQDDQLVIGPMNQAELRRAIVEPARKARFDVENGLVEVVPVPRLETIHQCTEPIEESGLLIDLRMRHSLSAVSCISDSIRRTSASSSPSAPVIVA